MLARISLIVATILLILPTLPAQPAEAVKVSEEIALNSFNAKGFPGMAIAVAKGHEWMWTTSFGFANIEDSIKIDPAGSLFRIGSVSKTLTAAGLMQLYEHGQIDLDAEIQEYVKEFPEKKYPVTVRQIAQHIGGIRHYNGMEFLNNQHYETVREGLVIFANDDLKFEPGTQYAYSSYGWNLISAAMETASETQFLAYMHDNVFMPSGMAFTYPDDVNGDLPRRVSFYEKDKKPSIPVDNSYKWAGGGFLSTSTDLIKFAQAILDNALISAETLDVALETPTLGNGSATTRGIGFEVTTDKSGRPWIGHGGGSIGGTTMLVIYPDQELIVVVLVNQSGASVRDITFDIADQFLNK